MVQARVHGRPIVKTAFPLGQRRGHVFTSGRHALGRPELVLLNQPLEAKDPAVRMLEFMATLDFKEGGSVVEDAAVFVATAVPRDKARIGFESVEKRAVKPVPLGAPLPPWLLLPHAWMVPWSSSAANAQTVEKMAVKPVPLGAPLPPCLLWPHAWMRPSSSSAANAPKFAY